MIKLHKSTEYAIFILLELKKSPETITSIDKMIEGTKLPRRLMARVAAKLASLGLVKSKEGRGGGYMINMQMVRLRTLFSFIYVFQGMKMTAKPYSYTEYFLTNIHRKMQDISLNSVL